MHLESSREECCSELIEMIEFLTIKELVDHGLDPSLSERTNLTCLILKEANAFFAKETK